MNNENNNIEITPVAIDTGIFALNENFENF